MIGTPAEAYTAPATAVSSVSAEKGVALASSTMAAMLEFLHPTEPLRTAVRSLPFGSAGNRRSILLRHDVDHSLDAALRLAHAEWKMGIKATYFLLHGASYWDSPILPEAVRQLADFGHEVGLHINALAEWYSGAAVPDVLEQALARLRSTGVEVSGCSAHGDRRCYEGQFINYWCFEELRPADPSRRETGRSAEGVQVSDETRQIRYPADHRIVRPDGEHFDLWSLRMADFGLEYEASHVATDRYFSDSGGTWKDGEDPQDHDLSTGTSQILIHPEHWQAGPRTYWFLSTARAGSKWLTGRLDKAASVSAFHETTLNVVATADGVEARHITGPGFNGVANDSTLIRSRVIDRLGWIDDNITGDYAECNVYLPFVLDDTLDLLRRGTLIHLRRDPWAVISSLLERDWYDTAHDNRHLEFTVPGWTDLPQVERIAWYVRVVQERLDAACDVTVDLADLACSQVAFSRFLESIGIAYYPRLAGEDFDAVVDATRKRVFPQPRHWPRKTKKRIRKILTAETAGMGIVATQRDPIRDDTHDSVRGERLLLQWSEGAPLPPLIISACTLEDGQGARLIPMGTGHAHAVIGGSHWRSSSEGAGFAVDISSEYRATVEGEVQGVVWLFLLAFSESGELLRARRLTALQSGTTTAHFRVRPDAARFDIAVYIPHAMPVSSLGITRLSLIASQTRADEMRAFPRHLSVVSTRAASGESKAVQEPLRTRFIE